MKKQDKQQYEFQQLLDYCSDRESPHWQAAWGQFIESYKNYIYKVILNRCTSFKHPRIQLNVSEHVNDIFADVMVKLTANQCKILQDFHERDNEKIFLSWLGIISSRCALNELMKIAAEPVVGNEVENFQDFLHTTEPIQRSQLFEDYVAILRDSKENKRKVERDILLFNLYIWADFTTDMIADMPCFHGLGERVVDNLVHRIRKLLRENSD
ncbi:MAG: RNA polymerase sigma factor [bacterium]